MHRAPHTTQPAKQTNMCLEEVTGTTPLPEQDSALSSEHVSLKPPQALFKPIDYPPLHIFVSTVYRGVSLDRLHLQANEN